MDVMDIDTRMAGLIQNELDFYSDMEKEYEERLTFLRDTRNDILEMVKDIDNDAGEDKDIDPEDHIGELMDIEDSLDSTLKPDDLKMKDVPEGLRDKLMGIVTEVQEKSSRVTEAMWRSELKDALSMYLDAIDTNIAQVEADQALLSLSRARFEALQVYSGL